MSKDDIFAASPSALLCSAALASDVLAAVAALDLRAIATRLPPGLTRVPQREQHLDMDAFCRHAARVPGSSLFIPPPPLPPALPPPAAVAPATRHVARDGGGIVPPAPSSGAVDSIARFVSSRVFGGGGGGGAGSVTLPRYRGTGGGDGGGGDAIAAAGRTGGVKREREAGDADDSPPPGGAAPYGGFRTGRDLAIANGSAARAGAAAAAPAPAGGGAPKRRMGVGLQRPAAAAPTGVAAPYKNPVAGKAGAGAAATAAGPAFRGAGAASASGAAGGGGAQRGASVLDAYDADSIPEQLQGIDPKYIEDVEMNVLDNGDATTFDDIAGLLPAKSIIFESVVLPTARPDLFGSGLTRYAKGVLLFGPPGTGKTLIGKAVAHECGATFFNISASAITSKWIGESEKLVKALFAVASVRQPAVIFIDEIDSLLTSRSDGEHESTRRVKTEFLVQIDGAATRAGDFVVVIGATNRPQELDEAARRRFTKRIYVPLPDDTSRRELLRTRMRGERCSLSPEDLEAVVVASDGYSGADLTQVCVEAAWSAMRASLARCGAPGALDSVQRDDFEAIQIRHFTMALETVKPTVSSAELGAYTKWDDLFGTKPSEQSIAMMLSMRGRQRERDSDRGAAP